jgi:polyhydroxybutyrate depolymerase
VVLFHGTKDRIVPYDGGRMAAWARLAFRVDGAMLSAPETAAYFAARNGITAPPVTTEAGPEVSRTDYRQDGHAPVTLYTVHGGGHTVPGPHPSPRLMGRTATGVHAVPAIRDFLSLA